MLCTSLRSEFIAQQLLNKLLLDFRCGCKAGCNSARCGCRKKDLPCTPACGCCLEGCVNPRNPNDDDDDDDETDDEVIINHAIDD